MPETRLVYSIVSTPNPITCSIGGDHPQGSDTNLLVMINNRGQATEVDSIEIVIHVGAEDGSSLSTANALPQPLINDSAQEWNITVSGSQVMIEPKSQTSSMLTDTLMFTLPGIRVNETPGNVPITITENTNRTATVAPLVKLPADFPVGKFYVEKDGAELNPAVVFDLDQTVTVKWDCSSQGDKNAYRLRQSGTTLGDQLTATDGRKGVESSELQDTNTVFELDVLDPHGNTTETLTLTVWVVLPAIAPNSYVKKYLSGRMIGLHWLATNASKCVVEIDGGEKKYDNAPTDTWQDGYLVALPDAPGPHSFTVRAHPRIGSVPASHNFEPVSVDSFTIPTPIPLTNMAITPNGKYALGFSWLYWNQILKIDLLSNEVVSIPVGNNPSGIAITPDSRLALIANSASEFISVIDIENASPESIPNPQGSSTDVAITQDGKFALFTNDAPPGTVTVITVVDRTVEIFIPIGNFQEEELPIKIAIAETLRDKVAVITTTRGIRFIDLKTWTLKPTAILTDPTGPGPIVTPDGKVALIGNYINRNTGVTLQAIDTSGSALERATIQSGLGTQDLALTPDGNLAALNSDGTLTLIKLPQLEPLPLTVQLGIKPQCMAISGTGNVCLVAPQVDDIVGPGSVIVLKWLETD